MHIRLLAAVSMLAVALVLAGAGRGATPVSGTVGPGTLPATWQGQSYTAAAVADPAALPARVARQLERGLRPLRAHRRRRPELLVDRGRRRVGHDQLGRLGQRLRPLRLRRGRQPGRLVRAELDDLGAGVHPERIRHLRRRRRPVHRHELGLQRKRELRHADAGHDQLRRAGRVQRRPRRRSEPLDRADDDGRALQGPQLVLQSTDVGREAAEPTLGVDKTGTAFYAASTFDGPGGEVAHTLVLRSRDAG